MDFFKKLILIFVFIFPGGVCLSFNNDKPDNKIIRKADNLFIFGDFKNALPIYQKLQENSPENSQFNYRLAVCYFYASTDVLKCIPFFEKAKKNFNENDEETIDLYYYLGTAYRMINKFDAAIECFSTLKSRILPDKEGLEDIKELEKQINDCLTGKELIKNKIPVTIINLGPEINSEYPDYSPVISNDESMLLFTSKRKECTGGRIDEDGNFYEDVFISRKEKNETWKNSVRLDTSTLIQKNLFSFVFSKSKSVKTINTKEHDASVALSPDGKQLYIYRLDDLWVSDFKNQTWEKPTKLNHFINAKKSHEPSLSLSIDEKTLYFVSEREGGYGGKDIYKSEKQNDGSWGEPHNLGPAINSEYDEDAPYIDPQNKILYFSSEAHGSMGGFDIFKSKFENNSWSKPENLGYPVNSGADDIFYVYNSAKNVAYFSSIREDGIGNYDLYIADYNPSKNKKSDKTIIAVLEGEKLKDSPTFVTVTSGRNTDSLQLTNNILEGGNYVSGQTYSLSVLAPDKSRQNIEFTMPLKSKTGNYFQEIAFEEIKNKKNEIIGYKTSVYNAFFDIDSAIQNTAFEKIPNKMEAYSAYIKSLKSNKNGLDAQVYAIEEKTAEKELKSVVLKSFAPVLFEFNKSNIEADNIVELSKIYDYLNDDNTSTLIITGYTDSKGDESYNQKLSEARSLRAKKYFIIKGISEKRIVAVGKGENNPVSGNTNSDGSDNPEGRKQNRRIEFEAYKK
jgi:outer membrane protein OmpA-like peptidoglycan-associated protein